MKSKIAEVLIGIALSIALVVFSLAKLDMSITLGLLTTIALASIVEPFLVSKTGKI